MKRSTFHVLTALAICVAVASSGAQAATQFYNSAAAFDAATTTTLSDFEGIAPAGGIAGGSSTRVVDGVTYTGVTEIVVLDSNAPSAGAPYLSDILGANFSGLLDINFATAGGGFTAAGGFFGDIGEIGTFEAPQTQKAATLTLIGNGGMVLDVQAVMVGSFSTALNAPAPTFFGWTTSGGDTIEKILFTLIEDNWEGVDDIRFGTLDQVGPGPEIPEPTSLVLFGLTAIGMAAGVRRRRRLTDNAHES